MPIILLSRPRLFSFLPEQAIRPYLVSLSALFVVSFLAGTLAPTSVRNEATEAFQFFAEHFQGLSGGMLFFNILAQNVMASILILISGVLIGIIPILSMVSNGFLLGVLYRHAGEVSGYSKAALKVLPHGVFELPALLIAASYGLWLGVTVVRRIRGRESTLLRFHIEHAFRRYFAVVFPLLIVAAAIETALAVM